MKFFKLLFFSVFFISVSFAQVSNSVLANGDWYKFSIDTTGVFKIDANFLRDLGVSISAINPNNIKIYGNGGQMLPVLNSATRFKDLQENAIYVDGADDGRFDNQDFILFYAQGPHTWQINPNNKTATHQQNIFSDKAYYFLTIGTGAGKRISNFTPITTNTTTQITTFNDFVFLEKEEVNILGAGTQWFFRNDFSVENSITFNIPFANLVTSQPVTVKTRAVSTAGSGTNLSVILNNQNLHTLNFTPVSSGGLTKVNTAERTTTVLATNSNLELGLTYNNNGNPSAKAYLDYIEISGIKALQADDKQFSFRSFEQFDATTAVNFTISNPNNIYQIWDVTDILNPKQIINESTTGNFQFKALGGQLSEYIVLNDTDFFTPEIIERGPIENQNLLALKDVNYLVITNNNLLPEAQRLADYHTQNSNLTTKVVDINKIYNEFSSGSKDITGIRDFIKHLYTTNTSTEGKLQYVCFFGDASYDYKDRLSGNNNIVPVKLAEDSFNLASSYVTDDFYVMLEANEGAMAVDDTLDVISSRIPVSDVAQAKAVVDKILSYYGKKAIGDWRNTITLLADDIDATGEDVIQGGVEEIADEIRDKKPIFNVNKIYLDAFVQQNSSGGERYPQVNTAISNAIEKGTLVFDYFGHGGEDGFASERILEKPQIQAFSNTNTLPLLITVTCDFSRFDNPNRITAGELTFWNTSGGAASMITTTREVFINVGQRFNTGLIKLLLEFNNEDLTIAEALLQTKNSFRSTQKFFIYAFGDPAMKLAVPEPNVTLTKVNGKSMQQPLDTIKALSKISIEGVVVNNQNQVLNGFNGTLSTTVFDKPIDKTTLDNDGFGVIMNFDTQDSKIFKGKATVKDGAFKFDFIVPKDIKIAYGKAKLSFYAENGVDEKAGYNFDVTVGGINTNAPEDNIGPEINLFMNDDSFVDGGNTNTSPNLIVKLSDISGINTSITAVDHDIVAILDNDAANPIILNDFYQTELDDFTRGTVTYRLRDLEVGPHTLTLKAWDTYNNSSTTTLNFVVVSDAVLNLDNVLNYPNPFVNYTEFWFNHNKPNEPLEVQVQIFTVSGKLIKTINRLVQTEGNLSRGITWNGLDDFGNKIGKGVYVYKLKVTATQSNLSAEKYEKLVILQ